MRGLACVVLAVVGCVPSLADTALIPLKHVEAGELTEWLEQGELRELADKLDGVWPVEGAIVVKGKRHSIREFRELVALLDEPAKYVSLDVEIVRAPRAALVTVGLAPRRRLDDEEIRYAARYLQPINGPAFGLGLVGLLAADLHRVEKAGGVRWRPEARLPAIVRNNRMEVVWLGDRTRDVCTLKGLGAAVGIRPRVNADESITLWVALGQAVLDPVEGARIEWGASADMRVPDGHSLLFPVREAEREGDRSVLVVVTPRLLGQD